MPQTPKQTEWEKEFDEKFSDYVAPPKKRWCKFSKEATDIGYKEERDGVIIGESRKGEWRVKWGGNKSAYYYEKYLIEELPRDETKDDLKSFIRSLLASQRKEIVEKGE